MEYGNDSDLKILKDHLGFTIEIRNKLLDNYWKEMPQLFQHSQSLMSILGIIAGFGFTAFQYIKSRPMFFLGELFVIGSVLYLVYTLKVHIAGQPVSTEKMIDNFQDEARQIKIVVQKNDASEIKTLADRFKKRVNDVSESPRVQNARMLSHTLENAFWVSSIGIIFIVVSFIFCF